MNPNDEELFALLERAQTIAMVGASPDPRRPSHGVMQRLLDAGYRVIPINPNADEVLGCKSFASLQEVDTPIDIVNVFRRSQYVEPIAAQAVAVRARALWLQLGVVSEAGARVARSGGLIVVMDLCIAVVHSLLRVPNKRRAELA